MQRILQPGEIESLDHTSFPRVLLPNTSSLFLERASRIRQLTEGNPIADYLNFIASLVQAQHHAVQNLQVAAPDAAAMAQAQEFSSPLLPAADHLDPVWHQVLDGMLEQLSGADGLPAPESFRRTDRLRLSRKELIKVAEIDEALLGELEGQVRRLVTEQKKQLFLRADQAVPYGTVVKVMGIIKAAGVDKLGVVAEDEKSAKNAAAAAAAAAKKK